MVGMELEMIVASCFDQSLPSLGLSGFRRDLVKSGLHYDASWTE